MSAASSVAWKRLRWAAIIGWKTGQGCIDCGNDDPRVLDFDHRPGEVKLFTITVGRTTVGTDRLLAEIAKCDVRCANCHRIVTAERRGS